MEVIICLGVRARRLPDAGGAAWLREPDQPGAPLWADVVVRWGTPAGPAARVREFNRAAALAQLPDRRTRRELLRLAGLRVAAVRPRRLYRVALWDMVPCLLRRVRAGRRRAGRAAELLHPGATRLHRQVVEVACRALHALRLDFGVVDLRVRSLRDIAVVDVDPAPDPNGPEGRALVRALWAGLQPTPPEVTVVVADPELMFRDARTGRFVPASRYLARNGPIGLDSARLVGTVRPIAEVRPEPSVDPDRLVVRLRRLLRRLSRRVPARRLVWVAGSGASARFPIGGHIHFGGVPLSAALLRALDTYLAIPVLLLELPERARRRRRKYGWPGDFRVKGWGFEYRTLPSWLVGPRHARAVLHLAWLVARNWRRLTRDPFLDPALLRAFLDCDKEPFYALFPRLWADIQALPDYPFHAEALQIIYERIAERRCWPEDRDIRAAWGIRRA